MPALAYKNGIVAAKVGDEKTINPHALGSDEHAAWSEGYAAIEAVLEGESLELTLARSGEVDV